MLATNQTVNIFISCYIAVSCYEERIDLKQFTLQNKRLKIAVALSKQYSIAKEIS